MVYHLAVSPPCLEKCLFFVDGFLILKILLCFPPTENLSAPEVKNGDNGGHITSSNVIVESLTWQNNGGVYLCRAMNDLLEESVNDGLTLDVQCKMVL